MKWMVGLLFLSLVPAERVTIDSIATSKPWYAKGDSIALLVSAERGLAVTADFSAIDSAYRAGAERVLELETGYRIEYRLSRDNRRPSGNYKVLFAAQTSAQNRKTQYVDVRYLPQGRPQVTIPEASFLASNPDARRQRDDRIRIGEARFAADLKGIPGPREPKLFDDSRGLPAGTDLHFEVGLPKLGTATVASVELAQVGTSGHYAIPLDTRRPSSCAGGLCQFPVELTLQHDLAEDKVFSVQVGLYDAAHGHHTTGGARQFAWSLECDADPGTAKPYCQEPTGVYRVHGTITHDRRVLGVDPSGSPHDKAPQYEEAGLFTSVAPAREVMVRVADGCGLHHDTYTNSDGDYSIVFESWCGDQDATVTLYSVSAPGAGKQVALGVYTASPAPDALGDLVDDPDLYTVISGEVGTFNPEADAKVAESCLGGFCIGGKELDEHFSRYDDGALYDSGKFPREGEVARALTIVESVQMGLDYYRELVSGSKLPQINVVLTAGNLDEDENFAMFSKGNSNLIYLPPDMEWSVFGLLHETGHYFDGGVLVKDGLLNYGRWGEPMANVRAGMILGTEWMAAREYVDAETMDVQGNWDDDAGAVVVENFSDANPGQGWTWRVFWDLHDAGPTVPEPEDFGFGEFDQWDGGGSSTDPTHHLMNGVNLLYLPQNSGGQHPEYEDRGQSGPDLVDVLDGFACLYGMSQLQMMTLLHEVMSYDYDFGKCSEPIEAPGQ
jgi:hypothetical protein